MTKKYLHIYFDLDKTLWDFRKNSTETLLDIIDEYNLQKIVRDKEEFIEKYNFYNDRLWDYYRAGQIKKYQLRHGRFRLLLKDYNVQNRNLVAEISRYYMNHAPAKSALISGAVELLEYLSGGYNLYILSNGFYDVQLTKMVNSGISRYFKKLFTSDRIGYSKPDVRIFDYAVKSVNARKQESLMVGDDEQIDIKGAKDANIDQVHFNPEGNEVSVKANYTIKELAELKKWL